MPLSWKFLCVLFACVLAWLSLEPVSLAVDLTVSSGVPSITFDDISTATNFDWRIAADENFFEVIADESRVLLLIDHDAPTFSLFVDSAGKVGLGTEPDQKLHLKYGSFTGGIRLEQDTSLGLPARTWDLVGNNLNFFVQDVSAPQFTAPFVVTAGAPHFSLFVNAKGAVGLGTSTPGGNLHIFGAANKDVFNGIGPDLNAGPAFNFGYSGASFGPGSGFFNVRGASSGVNPSLRFATANVQRMIVTNAGRVGIGTLTPAQPLHVSGNIRTDGSFIAGDTTLNVPDYVFEPDYQLMPLAEVAVYVEKEKHLPDVPSAQEIKEQGVNLSELQMQMLKKMEELTLYAVEQEKTIAALKRDKREQDRVIKEFAARLLALERGHKQ